MQNLKGGDRRLRVLISTRGVTTYAGLGEILCTAEQLLLQICQCGDVWRVHIYVPVQYLQWV